MLSTAPGHIETFNEIAAIFNDNLSEHYNNLSAQERIVAYYLYRASLPGNRIATDQLSEFGISLRNTFLTLFNNEDQLLALGKKGDACRGISCSMGKFVQEVKTYLVYLWSNQGFYFLREHSHEKRTPHKLGLKTLTKDNIVWALEALKLHNELAEFCRIADQALDEFYKPTGTVPDSISQSGSNFYSSSLTDEDYEQLPSEQKNGINRYFYKDAEGVKTTLYAINQRYDKELRVSAHWLEKAAAVVAEHPAIFDTPMHKSLLYLIDFIKTGNEDFFKKHSIEWLKTKNRVDYCFGFIETYNDPKNLRGLFQAEATINTINMENLNKLISKLELKLPVEQVFKRDASIAEQMIPNASINQKIFGTGGLGPLFLTAAYCLPNYEDIRATIGSKQIIYPAAPGLGRLLNKDKSIRLSHPKKFADWLDEYDHDGKLFDDLWDVHCILHETIGHGSGKLSTHVFKHGQKLTVQGIEHEAGEIIAVTHENLSELLAGYDQTIEELRAEIIALYVSVMHVQELAHEGLLSDWFQKLGKQKLQELLIYHMLSTGLRRLLQQNDDATFVSGDHARANCTIMNYFIHNGGCRIVTEHCEYDGEEFTVIDLEITDFKQCLVLMRDLLSQVQRIKSTGDGMAAQALIQTYGIPIDNLEHMQHLKRNEKAVVGNLKGRVMVDPLFTPVIQDGVVVDIKATWPFNIFEKIAADASLEMVID